eukprot:3941278-Rhodomonas_salina.2
MLEPGGRGEYGAPGRGSRLGREEARGSHTGVATGESSAGSVLRVGLYCYNGVSGTEIGYSATTDTTAMLLPVVSGTEIGYAATRRARLHASESRGR